VSTPMWSATMSKLTSRGVLADELQNLTGRVCHSAQLLHERRRRTGVSPTLGFQFIGVGRQAFEIDRLPVPTKPEQPR